MDGYADIGNVKALVLTATGYDIPDVDDTFLDYLLQTECRYVVDDCNADRLFPPLDTIAEERAAGRFLQLQRSTILQAEDLDVVTSVKEGDTTVELGGTTPEARYDALIQIWLRERDLSCYRKLRW